VPYAPTQGLANARTRAGDGLRAGDIHNTGTVIGPGSIDVAHKPDEYVPRDELVRSRLIYRDVAMRILGDKAEPLPR